MKGFTPRNFALVAVFCATILGPLAQSQTVSATVVTIQPPGKNREYVYAHATRLLEHWNTNPRPEIRAVYDQTFVEVPDPLNPGRTVRMTESYTYQRITAVEIYARDQATGQPVGVFVTLEPLRDTAVRTISAIGDWKNTRGGTGTCWLILHLRNNGVASGVWGDGQWSFSNATWSGTSATWTTGKYNVSCTLGNPIVIQYDVPSEGYSGQWTSTKIE